MTTIRGSWERHVRILTEKRTDRQTFAGGEAVSASAFGLGLPRQQRYIPIGLRVTTLLHRIVLFRNMKTLHLFIENATVMFWFPNLESEALLDDGPSNWPLSFPKLQ